MQLATAHRTTKPVCRKLLVLELQVLHCKRIGRLGGDSGAQGADGAPDGGRCSGTKRADGECIRTAHASPSPTQSHAPSLPTIMSAQQRSRQLSSYAASLPHSSLLLAADDLPVPCRSRPELRVQTAATCTKVCRQPCHLCCPHSVRCQTCDADICAGDRTCAQPAACMM